ncbi:MAG: T9SS type A sorting domain-containing protein, partial [Ignavibacteriaceae bacterium]
MQNYPNPFNPFTVIGYSIKEEGNVELIIYDVLGKVVEKIVDERKTAGNYSTQFDASKLSSGIYFYSLRVNDFVNTKKMLLIK